MVVCDQYFIEETDLSPIKPRRACSQASRGGAWFPIDRRHCCSNDTDARVPLRWSTLFADVRLRICDPSMTILHPTSGGIHDCCAIRKFSACCSRCNHARGSDAADRKPRLYLRAAAGLHRRCVPPLQLGDSRHRPHHGLHGQEQITAVAWLPGILPRPGAWRDCGRARR